MNIQRFAGEFSGLRMIHGMANRAMVISEPMYKPDPYLPGQHFVSAPVEQMPDAIRYYLTHEREREEIATAGHQFVTQELTMERSLTRILELIRENV
jgi:spore maturation protein CgeB